MFELLPEVSEIAARMQTLQDRAKETEAFTTLGRLKDAAMKIGIAWCRSWYGYHANVYYRYFEPPSKHAFFDKAHGLTSRSSYENKTTGSWEECEPTEVIAKIERQAGNPNKKPIVALIQESNLAFQRDKQSLLSIIDILIEQSSSAYLIEIKEQLNNLQIKRESDFLKAWRTDPPYKTNDLRALQQGGLMTPPHLSFLCQVYAMEYSLNQIRALGDIAERVQAHLNRLKLRQNTTLSSTTIFLGHGRSP